MTTVRWLRIPTPVTPMILLESSFIDGEFPMQNWPDIDGADVRFRFHYPKEQEKVAKSAAVELEKTLIVAGAVKVKLDPVPIPTQTTRSLEIVRANTLVEKASLLWETRGLKLSEDEQRICRSLIEELQAQFGFGKRLTLDAGIHVKSTRLKGWRCFPEETRVDFDAIEGDVIAVSGPNGTGKSLFWEIAIPGALYRELPTHGNIGDHSTARDTFVETVFEYDGKTYTVTQTIDGKSGSGNTSLKIGKTPVFGTETALRTQYDKWAAANLPPFSLVKSTTFMPQESKGILGMGTKERKELILRAKGAERYEVLAEAAGKRSTAADKELTAAKAKAEELKSPITPEILQKEVRAAKVRLQGADEGLHVDVQVLATKRKDATAILTQHTEYNSLRARRAELDTQARDFRNRIGQLQGRIEVNQELTAEKEAIEKAVADITELEVDLAAKTTAGQELRVNYATAMAESARINSEGESLRQQMVTLEAEEQEIVNRLSEIEIRIQETAAVVVDADHIRKAVTEHAGLLVSQRRKLEERSEQRTMAATLAGSLSEVRARINGNAQRRSELTRKKQDLDATIALKERAQDAAERLTETERDIATADAELSRWRQEVEFLQEKITSSKDTRIGGLYRGHSEISQGLAEPVARAQKAMGDDHDLETEAEAAPNDLVNAKHEVVGLESALIEFRGTARNLGIFANRLPEVVAAEKALVLVAAEIETCTVLHDSLVEESNKIIGQEDILAAQSEQTDADIRWLQEHVDGLAPLVGRADLLATAKTKMEGLKEQAVSASNSRLVVAGKWANIRKEHSDLLLISEQQQVSVVDLGKQVESNSHKIAGIQRMIEALRPLASKAPQLAEAQVRIEEFLHQKSGLDLELEEVEHKRDGIELKEPPPPIDLAPYEAAVTTARASVADYQTRLALAEKDLADAEAKEARRQELTAQVAELTKAVDRWNLVERTLGRDGLQAEEIAAAGDEINELTNELLQISGAEYTVDLKTTKMTKDGKKEVEGCPINVHNALTREWQEGSTLSPGQRAFVNLPLSLALAMIGCKDSSVRPFLFQDEPTSGLDPIRRPQYLAMMRYAVKKVNASKMCFITHNQELIELADGHLEISGGKVSVQ